ncbi:MAG: acyltransferase domain-containing protein, partial [bacterium]|nr:acyltransferase domain-containing protein [bacterium]
AQDDSIAVIGMTCRFPGAENINEFWENLKNGIESITFFSHKELEEAGVPLQILEKPNYVKASGILKEIEAFDAPFFGYTTQEAGVMNPQIRIFHECAREVLEQAGYAPETYAGQVGLFAGATPNLAWDAVNTLRSTGGTGQWMTANLNSNSFVTLVSYRLDLKGPAVAVQTACSTSLTAVDTARRYLLTGNCDMALAGGVAIGIPTKTGYHYEEGMIMSPDGHCRAFDARANGTVAGSGCGIVLLKPLDKALQDGDQIHAVLKGTAVNNDGRRKIGYTAPSVEGQQAVIRGAHEAARIDPTTIGYVETHGTGTALGDPVEIEALGQAFQNVDKGTCRLGAVKTNIGHLDSAAGIAGFIKTVLVLKHKQIPPTLHYRNPNPKIDFANTPFIVNSELYHWKTGHTPRRAGVSSFGIGGTNVHAVLEEAPQTPSSTPGRENHIYMLSAKTAPALERMTGNLRTYFETNKELNAADAAYTLQTGRETFAYKRMLVCNNIAEAAEILSTAGTEKIKTFANANRQPPVVFMFPGQGAQYVDMGRELYQKEPYFRREIDNSLAQLETLMEIDLKEILYPGENTGETGKEDEERNVNDVKKEIKLGKGSSRIRKSEGHRETINETEITQPAIFIIEYALAKLLMKWGITPDFMIGHSIGEYTAACLSGVFSLEDALRLVVLRGKAMQGLPTGSMLSVPLPVEELEPQLGEELSLAAVNSSGLCVVSGPDNAVDAFEEKMKAKRQNTRRLHTSHAFHSAMMDPILEEFEKAIKKVKLNPPQKPYISNVTGKPVEFREISTHRYWSRHLRGTVRFAEGAGRLLENEGALFIEVGPGETLTTFIRRHAAKKTAHKTLGLMRRPGGPGNDHAYLLDKLGEMWLYGVTPDWNRYYEDEVRQKVNLPTYSFEKIRYPVENPYAILATITAGQPPAGETGAQLEEPRAKETEIIPPTVKQAYAAQRPQLTVAYVEPATPTEKALAAIWRELFGITEIGINDSFYEIGGDSLKAMTLTGSIRKKLKIELPLTEFFTLATIKEMAVYIETATAKTTRTITIPGAPESDYYPITTTQEKPFIGLEKVGESSVHHNMSVVYVIKGKLDIEKLDEAFRGIVQRHETLRSSFHIVNGRAMQRVDNITFRVTHSRNTEEEAQKKARHFAKPFDLSRAPHLRIELIQVEDEKYYMLFDMHHIVYDGTSLEIMIREFGAIYSGIPLEPLPIQFKDYAVWQNNQRGGPLFEKQEKYWLEKLDGFLYTQLPYDTPPTEDVMVCDRETLTIEDKLFESIDDICNRCNVTRFTFLMAIFHVVLVAETGQNDVTVGVRIATRQQEELRNLIGVILSKVFIRSKIEKGEHFSKHLEKMNRTIVEALDNSIYPYELLAAKLKEKKESNLLSILVNYLPPAQRAEQLQEPTNEPVESPLSITMFNTGEMQSRYDIDLMVIDSNRRMQLRFNYKKGIYKKEKIKKILDSFETIIKQVLENTRVSIETLV